MTCSARTGDGIAQIWNTVLDWRARTIASGEFDRKRKRQAREAMYRIVRNALSDRFFASPEVREELRRLEDSVMEGRISAESAAQSLLGLED